MREYVQTVVNGLIMAWGSIYEYILIKSRLNPWGYYMAQEPNDLVFLAETVVIIPLAIIAGGYLLATNHTKKGGARP